MINYADGDQIDGYKKIDEIFTKAKLNVLDEIREVRPGFYLGRSNIKNQFALNFTLYDAALDVERIHPSECE